MRNCKNEQIDKHYESIQRNLSMLKIDNNIIRNIELDLNEIKVIQESNCAICSEIVKTCPRCKGEIV